MYSHDKIFDCFVTKTFQKPSYLYLIKTVQAIVIKSCFLVEIGRFLQCFCNRVVEDLAMAVCSIFFSRGNHSLRWKQYSAKTFHYILRLLNILKEMVRIKNELANLESDVVFLYINLETKYKFKIIIYFNICD